MGMNVALIGASGKIGTKITEELLQRGHSVSGIARHPENIVARDNLKAVQGDIESPDALADALKNHDAIICAASFITGKTELLIDAVRKSGVKRFLMVGGAASLKNAEGKTVLETLELPEEWMVAIREGVRALELLRAVDDVDWTFFSPAVMIGPGERTGTFRLGTEQVVADANGESKISYDDYAIAMVDELEQGNHLKSRFTIGY